MKPAPPSCCTPSRGKASAASAPVDVTGQQIPVTSAMVPIAAGKFQVGTKKPQISGDGESPVRSSRHDGFLIAPATVTNQEFSEFINATGYVTEAERFGWSFVFYSDLPKNIKETKGVVGTEWWRVADGADWRNIHGPGTEESAWKPDHPVVQVSWNDAAAYAKWVGGRLPTEAEWEHAARAGQSDVRFPWGNEEPDDTDTLPCNIWQGKFPEKNTGADGWYNMVGNVWEWTADPFRISSLKKSVQKRMKAMKGYKLLKGGSFLCHRSYCYRYRIAARIGNSPDSTTTHQGFRVVWDSE